MYNFLVLGLIPGTNLQITFQTWLDMLELLLAIVGLIWLYAQHHRAIEDYFTPRQPLPASKLHRRMSY